MLARCSLLSVLNGFFPCSARNDAGYLLAVAGWCQLVVPRVLEVLLDEFGPLTVADGQHAALVHALGDVDGDRRGADTTQRHRRPGEAAVGMRRHSGSSGDGPAALGQLQLEVTGP